MNKILASSPRHEVLSNRVPSEGMTKALNQRSAPQIPLNPSRFGTPMFPEFLVWHHGVMLISAQSVLAQGIFTCSPCPLRAWAGSPGTFAAQQELITSRAEPEWMQTLPAGPVGGTESEIKVVVLTCCTHRGLGARQEPDHCALRVDWVLLCS